MSMTPDINYRFFKSEVGREEIFKFTESIVAYVRDNSIENVILIDSGARPISAGIKEYWGLKYPEENMPDIYFLNPEGFKNRDTDVIINEFEEIYGGLLMENRTKPTLIFDTCIHTGETLLPIINIFEKMMFNFNIGSITPENIGSLVHADYYITMDQPERGCHAFMSDLSIVKGEDSIVSKKSYNPIWIIMNYNINGEIKQIINDNIRTENIAEKRDYFQTIKQIGSRLLSFN